MDSEMNRRDFFKAMAVMIAGAVVSPKLLGGEKATSLQLSDELMSLSSSIEALHASSPGGWACVMHPDTHLDLIGYVNAEFGRQMAQTIDREIRGEFLGITIITSESIDKEDVFSVPVQMRDWADPNQILFYKTSIDDDSTVSINIADDVEVT